MYSEGIDAALDLVDEVEALLGSRLDVDHDVAELAAATGLADEAADDLLGALADRLAVGDLRAADVRLDGELAEEAVDEHLQVKLAHAVDDGLAGLLVGLDLEGGILFGKAREAGAELLLVRLRLRLDRDGDDGLGEGDLLEDDGSVRGAERVAGRGLLEADAGEDVARVALLDVLAVVRVHHQQAADPLGASAGRVEHAAARRELAGVDAEVGELADEGVGHDLEGKRCEWRRVIGRPLGRLALGAVLVRDEAAQRAAPRAARGEARRSRRGEAARPCS